MTTATPRPVPGPPKPAPPPPPPRTDRPDSGRPDPGRIEEPSLTGAQSLVRSLEEAGCEVVFGIPGGAILPAYDPLLDSTRVRHVLVRHEQGAGHAATGYAQANGKVGVCMATSGPGATNLITPLADAHMDSVPIVAITGQVAKPLIGTDAFQEADITGITMPMTKHNMLVTDAAEIPRAIAEAFHLASTGRPGPVLVDISKDALQAKTTFSWPPELRLPGYRPTTRPHGKQIREAAKLICAAHRPVLYVGGGVLKAEACDGAPGAGRADEHPGDHHADGAGCLPGQPPAARRHARHARQGVRGRCAAEGGPARRARRALRRPGHRPARDVRPGREDRARRHRPGRDREEPPRGRPDRGRLQGGARRPARGRRGRAQERHRRPDAVVGADRRVARHVPARLRLAGRRVAVAAVRHPADREDRRTGRDLRGGRGPAPDVGGAVHRLREAADVAQLRRPRHDGLRGARGDGRQGRAARTPSSGPSTATAASR